MNDKSTKSVSTAVSRTIAGEWETPDELFKELDRKYHFNLDACARPELSLIHISEPTRRS